MNEGTQEDVQKELADIHQRESLSAAMQRLFRLELGLEYITTHRWQSSERHAFLDEETGITFRLQINVARSKYSPVSDQNALHCLLCKENLGRPGKESLRIYEFDLGGVPFFLQLTPYPLFTHHFVLILTEPRPQNVNEEALKQMFLFLEMAPDYTVCSNSDVAWAGSSILEHMHFQVFRGLHLPVMEAAAQGSFEGNGVAWQVLRYPMAAVRILSESPRAVFHAGWRIVDCWKSRYPGRNTVNLVLRKVDGRTELTVFLRNPDYRTPSSLWRLKKEGVGVIEAAGEAILPVPEDPKLLRLIREDGLSIVKGIISGNSPIKSEESESLLSLVSETNLS